jgi:hypothetical protein
MGDPLVDGGGLDFDLEALVTFRHPRVTEKVIGNPAQLKICQSNPR